jgi:prolyl oligopeptidase
MAGEVRVGMAILATVLGLGCPGRDGGAGPTTPAGDEAVAADRALLAELTAVARRGAVSEAIHGVTVEDPFRALEEDSESTRSWIEAQTARTERLLEPHADARMRARLDQLMSIGLIGRVEVAGGRIFYTRREADQEQAVLLVREGPDAPARDLLDPSREGERVAVDWFFPSPAGRLVAVGLSREGDERSVLRVLDAGTAEETGGERIEHCKWTTVSWLPDESGFYYTRYPREGEEGFRPDQPDSYFPRVFLHRLGTDPATDLRVYGAAEPDDFPWPSVSDDGRWLVVNVMRGWSRSDVYLLDREAPGGELVTVQEGCDCLVSGSVRRGRLWLLTNEGHPRYRVLSVAPEEAASPEARQEVVPESDATIDGFDVAGDRLVVHDLHGFASRLRSVGLDGGALGEVPLPAEGSVAGLTAEPGSSRFALVFSSFFYPPALLVGDAAAGGEPLEVERVRADVAVDRYVVRRETVRSADGTEVNVFLVHDREARADGQNRVMLYGYGGFNVSVLPSFSRRALYWLERGGTYAVANLRGGGELGEAWHRAGMLENKERVFDDFEAVLRWLTSSGWSSPERIAILGGSNGGLLVGAALTRCPDAFGAGVGYVGLYDMLRYDRFPPAELWVSEYGSAREPDQLPYLLAYSPYHNVRDGVAYPAVLVETADRDTRVHWGHSTKFAARLQEASATPERVLFYMDRSVGHGAGTGRTDTVDQTVRLYAFLARALGLGGDREP